jgi:hypothetical protein
VILKRLFCGLGEIESLIALAQQVWQLGDIRRDPSRFICCEQLGRRASVTLPVGLSHRAYGS